MLAADKQLLDAQLRNELQQLRRLEITNVVNRFQNALTPATLIAGFTFTSIIELELTDMHDLTQQARTAERGFYLLATTALGLALYVTAISSMAIVFGQRLTIQATSAQGSNHDGTVRELNTKFAFVLVALGLSLVLVCAGERLCLSYPNASSTLLICPHPHALTVMPMALLALALRVIDPALEGVGLEGLRVEREEGGGEGGWKVARSPLTLRVRAIAAAACVVWIKDPTEKHEGSWMAIVSTVIISIIFAVTIVSMVQMFMRLHTPNPAHATLALKAGKGKGIATVSEFYVTGDAPPPPDLQARYRAAAAAAPSYGRPPDESSSLLCFDVRPGKDQGKMPFMPADK